MGPSDRRPCSDESTRRVAHVCHPFLMASNRLSLRSANAALFDNTWTGDDRTMPSVAVQRERSCPYPPLRADPVVVVDSDEEKDEAKKMKWHGPSDGTDDEIEMEWHGPSDGPDSEMVRDENPVLPLVAKQIERVLGCQDMLACSQEKLSAEMTVGMKNEISQTIQANQDKIHMIRELVQEALTSKRYEGLLDLAESIADDACHSSASIKIKIKADRWVLGSVRSGLSSPALSLCEALHLLHIAPVLDLDVALERLKEELIKETRSKGRRRLKKKSLRVRNQHVLRA